MRRSLRIGAVAALLLVASAAGGIAYLYDAWKSRAVAETRRLGLPAYAANGLRHSLAAADTYAGLRWIGLTADLSAWLVDRLGEVNEYKEFYLRSRSRRDPTSEIYKDLYNNVVGVLAAMELERLGRGSAADRIAFLGQMTERHAVLHAYTDPRVPSFPDGTQPAASNLSLALATFKRDRPTLKKPMIEALNAGLYVR